MSKTIYILSVDGGGIRGVIPSRILQRIEKDKTINPQENEHFIHDKFDVFAGSSSGAMLLSGIAYHKYSMTKIIDKYINFENFSKLIPNSYRHIGVICLSVIIIIFCISLGFYFNRSIIGILFGLLLGIISVLILGSVLLYYTPLYFNNNKSVFIENYIGKHTPFATNNGKKVYITTYNMTTQKPEFFKSWDKNDYLIKDIIDASSAVPGLYPAVKINNNFYIDGGVTTNNPADSIYSEILKKYKGENIKIKILSIGCGRKKKFQIGDISNWGHLRWIISGNVGLFIGDEQMVDVRLKNFTDVLGDEYIRIDGEIDDLDFTNKSDEYKNKLNGAADIWFEENRERLINFFNN